MYAEIPVIKGQVAIVDKDLFDELNNYKWYALPTTTGKFYAVRRCKETGKQISMHRQILNAPKGKQTDHVNRKTLDNRIENLRLCDGSQNRCNRPLQENNKTGYRGVSWDKVAKQFRSQIQYKGKAIFLGLFRIKEKAALAYNIEALKIHGEFAQLNELPVTITEKGK